MYKKKIKKKYLKNKKSNLILIRKFMIKNNFKKIRDWKGKLKIYKINYRDRNFRIIICSLNLIIELINQPRFKSSLSKIMK